jgi:hypothetical protein
MSRRVTVIAMAVLLCGQMLGLSALTARTTRAQQPAVPETLVVDGYHRRVQLLG